MRVAINAISVKEGGARVVLEQLLREFATQRPSWEFLVMASSRCPEPQIRNSNVQWLTRRAAEKAGALAWYTAGLAEWVKQAQADVLFSQTNYLPLSAPLPKLLLVQHAGYFCERFDLTGGAVQNSLAWKAKWRWIRHSLRSADVVTLQTNSLAAMLAKKVPAVAAKLKVIHHGPGQLADATPRSHEKRSSMELLYVSNYGVQKNFAVLLAAVSRLRSSDKNVRLHLTLTEADPGSQTILRSAAAQAGMREGWLVNHSALDVAALHELYSSADVFVFPSVCESFGLPLVEAMAAGLPVVAADIPGNRELCDDAALYFPFDDDERLARIIDELAATPGRLSSLAANALRRSRAFSWQRAASETLATIEGLGHRR